MNLTQLVMSLQQIIWHQKHKYKDPYEADKCWEVEYDSPNLGIDEGDGGFDTEANSIGNGYADCDEKLVEAADGSWHGRGS